MNDEIDHLLERAGEEWRARTKPEIPQLDTRALAMKGQPGLRVPRALAGIVAAGMIIAVLALALPPSNQPAGNFTQPPNGTSTPGPVSVSPTSPNFSPSTAPEATFNDSGVWTLLTPGSAVIHDGDRVIAAGYVRGNPTDLRICRGGVSLRGNDPSPVAYGCAPEISVAVAGLNVSDIPGWVTGLDSGTSGLVVVEGIWRDGAIAEMAIREAPAAPQRYAIESMPSTCVPPDGGWPGDIPDSIEGETALRALADEISQRPSEYVGYYRSLLDPTNPQGDQVTVVDVTGDTEADRVELTSIYPYNMCLRQVAIGRSGLESIAARLEQPPVILTNVSPSLAKVLLSLPFLTDQRLMSIGADADSVVVDPLVRPLPQM